MLVRGMAVKKKGGGAPTRVPCGIGRQRGVVFVRGGDAARQCWLRERAGEAARWEQQQSNHTSRAWKPHGNTECGVRTGGDQCKLSGVKEFAENVNIKWSQLLGGGAVAHVLEGVPGGVLKAETSGLGFEFRGVVSHSEPCGSRVQHECRLRV